MIDQSSIEQLKNIIDIVDVINNYIELKKNGSNYKALCPFHEEDTPSFVVSPSKQIFHCFGCGAGGDAIKFVMQYEKLNYPEAIEKLASLYNFSLQYSHEKRDSIGNLFKVLETINKFFKRKLLNNQKALEYLQQRGISRYSIEKFELGYAPGSVEQIEYIKSQLIPLQEAIDGGILAKDERVYARFIERITFPIYSSKGTLVGFGGRTITNHPAKYLNSPQTKLFNKSKLLYGYHLAKEDIFKKRRIIVCEGYLDVIMLHQAGFTTSVATLGTALTPSHLPLISRGEPEVILAYDGDKAGIEAALKASKLLVKSKLDGGVVLFPQGQDPADMVKNGNTKELEDLFESPKPFIEFILKNIVKEYDIRNPKEKEKALKEGVAFLKTLSPLLQDEYKHYLAALLALPVSRIVLGRSKRDLSEQLVIEDTKELSLLKTLLLNEHLIDIVLDIIDTKHFFYHRDLFEALLEGKKDHPKLRELLLKEDILPFEEEQIQQELFIFLIKYYENRIKDIKNKNLPLKEKAFLIRKYKENILKLRRGEMVIEDESISTF